jgi:pyruvate dehydrogenase E2 component (dihydrolipoamide acetyltransferase)
MASLPAAPDDGHSLSYDHRVIDGAMGARFSVYLSEVLGDMRKILL